MEGILAEMQDLLILMLTNSKPTALHENIALIHKMYQQLDNYETEIKAFQYWQFNYECSSDLLVPGTIYTQIIKAESKEAAILFFNEKDKKNVCEIKSIQPYFFTI